MKLLEEGIIIIKRDSNNLVLPIRSHIKKVKDDDIYIKSGQLNKENKLDGLGRKIHL